MKTTALFLCVLCLTLSLSGQQPTPGASPAASPAGTPAKPIDPKMDDPPVVQHHSVTVRGRNIAYTTTTGFMPIRNAASGETEARLFFIAYTMDNAPANRPLMFSFNG